MGIVIGPINGLNWRTMRLMRQTMNWLRENEPEKQDTIDRARKIYRDILNPYVERAA